MNKLRLIKIFEIRGKIHPIEQCVIDLLDGIDTYTNVDYILYSKNSYKYFKHFLNRNYIYLYYTCYENFDKFGCSAEETEDIFAYLLGKHLNITINEVY